MMNNDFENAFDAFLEHWTYDAVEDALFAAIRAAFMAGGWPPAAQNLKISKFISPFRRNERGRTRSSVPTRPIAGFQLPAPRQPLSSAPPPARRADRFSPPWI